MKSSDKTDNSGQRKQKNAYVFSFLGGTQNEM